MFGKLAVVPCTLQFVLSIRNVSMKWEGKLQAKGKKTQTHNPKPELTSMWIVIPGDKYTALTIKIKLKNPQNKPPNPNVQLFPLNKILKSQQSEQSLMDFEERVVKVFSAKEHSASCLSCSYFLHYKQGIAQGSCCGFYALYVRSWVSSFFICLWCYEEADGYSCLSEGSAAVMDFPSDSVWDFEAGFDG